jgi:hypothetical protein
LQTQETEGPVMHGPMRRVSRKRRYMSIESGHGNEAIQTML